MGSADPKIANARPIQLNSRRAVRPKVPIATNGSSTFRGFDPSSPKREVMNEPAATRRHLHYDPTVSGKHDAFGTFECDA